MLGLLGFSKFRLSFLCLFLAEQFRNDACLVGLLYSILISMAWQFKSIKQQQQQQQHQQHHEDLQHRREVI